jgi:CyaY protein
MQAADFARISERTLSALNRSLDSVVEDHDVEVLYQGGVLTLEVAVGAGDAGSKIIVSPNSAVSQIWISAQSTSFKLDWDSSREQFVWPGSGESLATLLGRLVGEDLGAGPLPL